MHSQAADVPRPRRARDFYFELISESQAPRSGLLSERERWLRAVKVEGREELLFELEMLLRGMERYFTLQNLSSQSEPALTRDFRPELTDIWDALNRVIGVARLLLDPAEDQKRVFRRYVESQLSDDRARRRLLEEELDEDSPAESLFVLRESFSALKGVLEHLLSLPFAGFPLFADVGNLLLGDIVRSRFFRPFSTLEFRLEYDRVKSLRLLEALRGLEPTERSAFGILTLSLFRLLHYVSYIGAGPSAAPGAGREQVVLALIRSEASSLSNVLSSRLVERMGSRKHQAFAMKAAGELQARTAEIAATLDKPRAPPAAWEGLAEAAAAGYTKLFRGQLARVAKLLVPGEESSFDGITSVLDIAMRLQRDLWIFAELCRAVEGVFHNGEAEQAEAALAALRSCIVDFEAVSYQLLRYGDIEPFDRFIAIIGELSGVPKGPVARARLAEDCRLFAQVAQATFAAVSRRADLRSSAFDLKSARWGLSRYWSAHPV